ncbi:MAG: hypothetical protein BXU00_03250 [Candidatus Nanoclepta minutus]|uniref:EamA domain-containing protein n=1 Tax=Candidatus Nanoclepta minutus TaxID=1940235 RepID=A0A397WNM7_9ARCH|nr:MAG: hypothetical protein BXU00_03250 [Candidatus Nanoclepta minutus]
MSINGVNWMLFAILSSIMAALSTIFAKIGLQEVDPIVSTTLRSIVIMVFSLTVMFSLRNMEVIKTLNNSNIAFIIISGIAGSLSWLFYFLALQRGNTTIVAAIDRSSIIFVLLFSMLFLNEGITLNKIIAIFLILIGLFLLIF